MSLSQAYVKTKYEIQFQLLVDRYETSFSISEIPRGEHKISCYKTDAPALIAAIAKAVDVTIEQIAQAMGVTLPQAQAWIPVSDHLPDEKGDYNVTIPDNESVVTWWFHPNSNSSCGPDSWRKEVIAWMPLPKTYKAGE